MLRAGAKGGWRLGGPFSRPILRITSCALRARTNGKLHRIPRSKFSYCALSAPKTRVFGGFWILPSPPSDPGVSREPPHNSRNHGVQSYSPLQGLSGTVLGKSIQCLCTKTRRVGAKPHRAFQGCNALITPSNHVLTSSASISALRAFRICAQMFDRTLSIVHCTSETRRQNLRNTSPGRVSGTVRKLASRSF